MTKEEIIKILRARGLNPNSGKWEGQKAKTVKSPIIEKQRENLEKLKNILELQIEKDMETVADLHIALQKVSGRKDG